MIHKFAGHALLSPFACSCALSFRGGRHPSIKGSRTLGVDALALLTGLAGHGSCRNIELFFFTRIISDFALGGLKLVDIEKGTFPDRNRNPRMYLQYIFTPDLWPILGF